MRANNFSCNKKYSLVGGMFITMTRNGMFYATIGASLFSAASTLILIPIRNAYDGKRMIMKNAAKEVAVTGSMGR
jgi:hypothetical protein